MVPGWSRNGRGMVAEWSRNGRGMVVAVFVGVCGGVRACAGVCGRACVCVVCVWARVGVIGCDWV